MIELRLQLREACELDIELPADVDELLFDDREDLRPAQRRPFRTALAGRAAVSGGAAVARRATVPGCAAVPGRAATAARAAFAS